MARQKKLGIEACPKCGNLGRRHRKKIRNRPSGRYHKCWYFLHNDRSIRECCIDILVRPKQMTPVQEFQDGLSNFGYIIGETIRRLSKLPLTDKEWQEVWSALKWADFNICIPIEVLKKIYSGRLKVQPEEKTDLESTIIKNLNSKKNMFGQRGFKSLSIYQKYIVPSYENRRTIINQKLRNSYNYPRRTLPDYGELTFNPLL